MSKIALFDDDGRCIGLFTGEQDVSYLTYAYAAEVDGPITPNEAVYNIATDEVEQQAYSVERDPDPPRALFEDQLADLRSEIIQLRDANFLL